MTTLELIKHTATNIGIENGIFGNDKNEEITLPHEVVERFVKKVQDDLDEFNTLEQFDDSSFNLFSRAFLYIYGKGAETAFFCRLGNVITEIDYDFDKAMQGISGEKLPDYFHLVIGRKVSAMLDMYVELFKLKSGPQEKIISEGITSRDCISTILSIAFYCGSEVYLATPLSETDKGIKYLKEKDKPYGYNNYNQKYKVEDFKIINYEFLDFKRIKDQL